MKFHGLLKYMCEHDGLADDKLPFVRKYGGNITQLLIEKVRPSLIKMRNTRAHGTPFGSGYPPGLPELVHDLIEYAYRERIRVAAEHRNLYPC